MVWVHLLKERFPSKCKNKLMESAEGLFQILEKYGYNAYKVDLHGKNRVHTTLIIVDFSSFLH